MVASPATNTSTTTQFPHVPQPKPPQQSMAENSHVDGNSNPHTGHAMIDAIISQIAALDPKPRPAPTTEPTPVVIPSQTTQSSQSASKRFKSNKSHIDVTIDRNQIQLLPAAQSQSTNKLTKSSSSSVKFQPVIKSKSQNQTTIPTLSHQYRPQFNAFGSNEDNFGEFGDNGNRYDDFGDVVQINNQSKRTQRQLSKNAFSDNGNNINNGSDDDLFGENSNDNHYDDGDDDDDDDNDHYSYSHRDLLNNGNQSNHFDDETQSLDEQYLDNVEDHWDDHDDDDYDANDDIFLEHDNSQQQHHDDDDDDDDDDFSAIYQLVGQIASKHGVPHRR